MAQWTVGQGSIQDYLAKELKDVPTISYDSSCGSGSKILNLTYY